MTEDEAKKHFASLMHQAVNTTFTQVNDYFHLWRHA